MISMLPKTKPACQLLGATRVLYSWWLSAKHLLSSAIETDYRGNSFVWCLAWMKCTSHADWGKVEIVNRIVFLLIVLSTQTDWWSGMVWWVIVIKRQWATPSRLRSFWIGSSLPAPVEFEQVSNRMYSGQTAERSKWCLRESTIKTWIKANLLCLSEIYQCLCNENTKLYK